MPTRKAPRKGSLQFWPRKRAAKFLPRVNWFGLKDSGSEKKLKGFIAYKAGMKSAIVVDNTSDSLTKGKKIAIPVTIIECPPLKILSTRFYKNNKPISEILNTNLDKDLKRKIKIPKDYTKKIEGIKPENYDDIRIIVYSTVKTSGNKKTPDLAELDLNGNKEEKLIWVKENLGKEIRISEAFDAGQLLDIRGITKGKGFVGSTKRFGLKLRFHKSEKGRRGAGSIAPWHPARITFRNPMPGQLGMFSRVIYNNKVLSIENAKAKPIKSIKNYGDIKTDYIIVKGSVQGPSKRQIILTVPLRPNKSQGKLNYEFSELQ